MKRILQPTMGDLPAIRHRYSAGDCLLATVRTKLDQDQRRKIYQTVREFAGRTDVSLLLYNTVETEAVLQRAGEPDTILARVAMMDNESSAGVANVDLTKVEFRPGDRIVVRWLPGNLTWFQRMAIKAQFAEWVRGRNVEVVVI